MEIKKPYELIKFDKLNGKIELPHLVLKNRSLQLIGTISKYTNWNSSLVGNGLDEITFDVAKYIGVDDKGNDIICPIWDELIDLKIVEVSGYGCFEISVDYTDDTKTVKSIHGVSLETELGQILLHNFHVNDEEDTSTYTKDADGNKIYNHEVTVFYNPDDKEHSLLHRVLADKAPHWSFDYVTPYIALDEETQPELSKTFQRTYTEDGTSIYDFLTGTVAEESNVIFVFNTFERKISVYNLCDCIEQIGEQITTTNVNINVLQYTDYIQCKDNFKIESVSDNSEGNLFCYLYDKNKNQINIINNITTYPMIIDTNNIAYIRLFYANSSASKALNVQYKTYYNEGTILVSAIGEDTTILVSKEKLANEITISSNKDEVKNCFRIEGGDDVITDLVRVVNMNGSNYIYRFADFQYNDMSSGLVKVLKEYQEDLLTQEDNYYGENGIYTRLCKAYEDLLWYESSMMPNVSIKDTTAEEQYKLVVEQLINNKVAISSLDDYDKIYFGGVTNNVEEMANIYVDSRYEIIMLNGSTYSYEDGDSKGIWTGNIQIKRTTNEDDYYPITAQDIGTQFNVTIIDDETGLAYTKQKIEKALTKASMLDIDFNVAEMTEDEMREYFDQYSLNRLKSFTEGYDSCLSELIKLNEDSDIRNELYNQYYTRLEITTNLLQTRQAQVDDIEDVIESILKEQEEFQTKWNFQNYLSGYFKTKLFVESDWNDIDIPQLSYTDYFTCQDNLQILLSIKTEDFDLNDTDRSIICYLYDENQNQIGDSITITKNTIIDTSEAYYFRLYYITWNTNLNYQTCFVRFITYNSDIYSDYIKCRNYLKISTLSIRNTSYGAVDLNLYNKNKELIRTIKGVSESQLIATLDADYISFIYVGDINTYVEIEGQMCFGENEDLYTEFCTYRREDTYKNDNYISDGYETDTTKLLTISKELVDVATKEIKKSCVLQRSISCSLNNLFAIPEFEPLYQKFALYNYIRIRTEDEVLKLRLIGVEFSGDSINEINVTFAEQIESVDGKISETESILQQASAMATSYSATTLQAKQGAEAKNTFTEMYTKGLNTAKTMLTNNDNNEITITPSGIICRRMDDVGYYGSKQLRITGNIMAYTKNDWQTVNMAIGEITFVNPITGEEKTDYGIIAPNLVGQLIAGENLYIGNEKGNVIITGEGIQLDGGTIIWTSPIKQDAVEGLDDTLSSFVEKIVYNQDIDNLQSQINGEITSWFYDYIPTPNNEPASKWITSEEQIKHEGDLFYNTATGSAYRYIYNKTTQSHEWSVITDEAIIKALADAKKAQDTADSKRRIFLITPTPPYDAGDLWTQTNQIINSNSINLSPRTYSEYIECGDTFEIVSINGISDDSNIACYLYDQNQQLIQVFGDIIEPITIDTSEAYSLRLYNWGDVDTSTLEIEYRTISEVAGDILKCVIPKTENESYEENDWVKASKYTDDTIANEVKNNFAQFKSDVNVALTGSSTTEIGSDYVISPKIGGGYLYITDTRETDNTNTSIEINPNGTSFDGHNSDYVFNISKGDEVVMGVTNGGDGYFSGTITGSSGEFTKSFEANVPTNYGTNMYLGVSDNKIKVGTTDTYVGVELSNFHTTKTLLLNTESTIRLTAGWSEIQLTPGCFDSELMNNFVNDTNLTPTIDGIPTTLKKHFIYLSSTDVYFGNGTYGYGYTNNSQAIISGCTTHIRGNNVRLYAQSGGGVYLGQTGSTAVTSDENLKNLYSIDKKYEEFFLNLIPSLYKYKDRENAEFHRTHIGFGARQVEQALLETDLTTEDFAGIVIDKDITLSADEMGTKEDVHFDELYSLRYEEFISLNTYMIQKLYNKIETLENEINELKEKNNE